MAKVNPSFPYDIFKFLHKPIRTADKDVDNFLERFLVGEQTVWEQLSAKIESITTLNNPEKIRADLLQHLKDIVGLTRDLRNITDALTEDDLRKVILLAIPLWKSKGLEVGFKNIIKLFTGFNARIFNWFDYRMIIGEKAIGEEQLGEDSWLISKPGIIGQSTLGAALFLLQFEDEKIKDRSLWGNPITKYGNADFFPGGPFGSSNFYLRGIEFFLQIPHRAIWDFSKDFTFEIFVKCWENQIIPLFWKWDNTLNKGIKLYIDTNTNEITYVISDGTTTQTNTIASGVVFNDNVFKHIVWIVDWDETSIWVDGTRKFNVGMNGGFLKSEINNNSDLFIGAQSLSSVGSKFGIDGIRITSDARYDVTLTSITPPATNYLEYIEEQLDEFQIDIRIVDDGTLDRTMTKRILNLMRGSSERLNLLFIDFYDDFVAGKGQYTTISGTGYVEKVGEIFNLKMPENSLEHVEVTGSTDWKNYLVQHRCLIYDGSEFEIRFLIQDDLNYYAFRVNSTLKTAYIEKSIAGTRTPMATPIPIDVEPAIIPNWLPYYVYLISTFTNENTGITTLKAYIDSNLIFSVDDNNFEKGTFGLFTPSNSEMWCSESEMFQLPLESDRIGPNSNF